MIQPGGGYVTSADGRLTVSVPAGAISAPTDFTIQVITNTAPSGVGNAFRITTVPAGVVLAAPVAFVFAPGPTAPPVADLSVAT
ncbi:MAG TPA: hypothetical protein VLS93_00125, partial [Anaeromyxobacteraceae bacterium]|nr:hypothetical protein [Anaeromyxobacteraceae bacterium]